MNKTLTIVVVVVLILMVLIYLRHRHVRDVILVENPSYVPTWYDWGYNWSIYPWYWWGPYYGHSGGGSYVRNHSGGHHIRNRGFDGGHTGQARFGPAHGISPHRGRGHGRH